MSRTVLITGAGGFVGSHLAEGFLAMGDAVVALDRSFDAPTRQRLASATLIEMPIETGMAMPLPQLDLVIHGAAITTPPHEFGLSDAQHVEANVELVRAALGIATTHGASDFVFLSSSGVFASTDGAGVHLESTLPTADLPYAQAKRAGEVATDAANSAELRAISVRLGPVYGPHEAPRSSRLTVSQVRRWLDRLTSGEPIVVAMPHEQRDWTFAPDLPHALFALLAQRPRMSGVVHLTSGQIVSNHALAQAIAALVDGATIAIEPAGDVARLPMGSDRIDLLALYSWTPLITGLARTIAAEARS